MTDAWYYIVNGRTLGPVTGTQLLGLAQAGIVLRNSQIQKAGMTNWVNAEEIKGLFAQLPNMESNPRHIPATYSSRNVEASPRFAKANSNRKLYVTIASVVAVIAIALVAWTAWPKGSTGGTADKATLKGKQLESAKSALKELRKLSSFTEAGIAYQEYQNRVLTAKAEIDNALLEIPSCAVKNSLEEALQAHVDARSFWGIGVNLANKDGSCSLDEDERRRFDKYLAGYFEKLKEAQIEGSRVDTDLVRVFWLRADAATETARLLLSLDETKK